MSVADLHDLELIWPSLGPTDVIVTGSFDQWSSSIHLVKGHASFVATVKVPWGQKIAYKFIVDGHWRCRDDHPQEDDGHGNINNILQTPEKPEFAAAHDPPTHLVIPLDGTPSEGYGDVEDMVTAIEFHPPAAEPAAIRGSLPLSIPQITVEGSPVNESKLNTARVTEGNVLPASVTPGSVPLPPVNASNGIVTHTPIQSTEGSPTSPMAPEIAVEVAAIPLESVVPQPGRSSQTDQADVSPVVVSEPTAKQPEVDLPETATLANRSQAAVPTSNDQASTPSTPASSTLTPKKWRSLFARIKHIFEKDKDKQERKEKSKH